MPAFLTHWRVLIETAQRSQDAGSDLGSLIMDTTQLQRRLRGLTTQPQTTPAGAIWHTGPLAGVNAPYPGSDIAAMAYLGALGPDIPGMGKKMKDQARFKENRWELLLHSNCTGDLLIALLEYIADIPSPALRSQALAFAMGYVTHIATDIALHPYIHALSCVHPGGQPGVQHELIEQQLDEHLAEHYFGHQRFSWFYQPWEQYVLPAISELRTNNSISSQLLTLLGNAAEATYHLTEAESNKFQQDYSKGLERLSNFLAGRGRFRWQTLAKSWKRPEEPKEELFKIGRSKKPEPDRVNIEETLTYAVRLSELLCRKAISYYASLRNTQASAQERKQRRTQLKDKLRNWDLANGYTIEVLFEEEITVRFLHNWIHFADLWENERVDGN